MVHKIKFLIFFLISFLLCFFCCIHKNNIETNIIKTLLPQNISNLSDIISITNKSSSVIRVVFEGESEKEVNQLKNDFISEIDKNYFEFDKPDITRLINQYLSQPNNFLSANTKRLLQEKKYDEVYKISIEKLYSVSDLQLSSFDKDPYLLADDFILSNKKSSNNDDDDDDLDKYDYMQLKIKNEQGLSPDIINKKIKELILVQKKLSNESTKIHLAGTPIHSYYSSKNAVISINIICILSTLLIIFLTYHYFKSYKPLLPITLSIVFGMLMGLSAVKLIFYDFQIITMVFSSTLIGIGIDYSYHYFFGYSNINFKKNLTFSFITSIVPFALLFLTNIDVLKQVAVFIVFGLFGIYLTILYIYPEFKINNKNTSIKINDKLYKIFLIILITLSLFGILRFQFNDSLSSLYTPSKKLQKAEMLYSNISNDNFINTQIITVKAKNIFEEEKVTKELEKNNISYISVSKLLPSIKIQKENFQLVKELYKNNLDNYSNILTSKQINKLKNSNFTPVEFNLNDYNYLKDFLLDDNTSMIFVFTNKKFNISNTNCQIINIKSDIESYMKKYRRILTILFPIVILVLYVLLTILYNYKKAAKILAPSIVGIIVALLINSLIIGELNLFNIITIFLVLGFTMDYSIFRAHKDEKTENAILISCATTSFSFLLLCFCGFKLLSSMAFILFFGIIASYLAGYFLFKQRDYDNIKL